VTAPEPYEPAVDCDGDEVWFNGADIVTYVNPGGDDDDPPGHGWRRLYVRREPEGGAAT
jgi:hypothetical protein